MIHIHLLVTKFECWSPNINCIVFVIQPPLYFVIKDVKIWIYHDCTKLFYKSNFNIFFKKKLFKGKK